MAKNKIIVDLGIRACVNCENFRQYFRKGELIDHSVVDVPVGLGYCLKQEAQRNALRKPCREYRTPEKNRE